MALFVESGIVYSILWVRRCCPTRNGSRLKWRTDSEEHYCHPRRRAECLHNLLNYGHVPSDGTFVALAHTFGSVPPYARTCRECIRPSLSSSSPFESRTSNISSRATAMSRSMPTLLEHLPQRSAPPLGVPRDLPVFRLKLISL
jgi:hypothetical protein